MHIFSHLSPDHKLFAITICAWSISFPLPAFGFPFFPFFLHNPEPSHRSCPKITLAPFFCCDIIGVFLLAKMCHRFSPVIAKKKNSLNPVHRNFIPCMFNTIPTDTCPLIHSTWNGVWHLLNSIHSRCPAYFYLHFPPFPSSSTGSIIHYSFWIHSQLACITSRFSFAFPCTLLPARPQWSTVLAHPITLFLRGRIMALITCIQTVSTIPQTARQVTFFLNLKAISKRQWFK